MELIAQQPHEVYLGTWQSKPSLQRLSSYSCVIVLTDTEVAKHWLDTIRQAILPYAKAYCQIVMPHGDAHKTRVIKAEIEDQLLQANIDRQALILGVGGGVVCDMAGFVAATYRRGIAHAFWPTSVMAMLDAAHGGKNGVNTASSKNSIGTVSMPEWVLVDSEFLTTLPHQEAEQGMAELIKHAILHSQLSCEQLLAQEQKLPRECLSSQAHKWLRLSIEVKMSYVIGDQNDHGKRQWLNLGHTLAHALEQVSAYTIPHGVAVAWGIWFEAALAKKQGLLAQKSFEMICQLLEDYNLLQALPYLAKEAIVSAMEQDKKNKQACIMMCLPAGMGLASGSIITSVEPCDLLPTLSWMLKISTMSRQVMPSVHTISQPSGSQQQPTSEYA